MAFCIFHIFWLISGYLGQIFPMQVLVDRWDIAKKNNLALFFHPSSQCFDLESTLTLTGCILSIP